jgi:hypothetical protein
MLKSDELLVIFYIWWAMPLFVIFYFTEYILNTVILFAVTGGLKVKVTVGTK